MIVLRRTLRAGSERCRSFRRDAGADGDPQTQEEWAEGIPGRSPTRFEREVLYRQSLVTEHDAGGVSVVAIRWALPSKPTFGAVIGIAGRPPSESNS